jgi:hypothetical protein
MATAVRACLQRSQYLVRRRKASGEMLAARQRLLDLNRLQRLNLAMGFRASSVRSAIARHDRIIEGACDVT